MAISVNSIPSVSVPLTDSRGRISPVWHEFLRSFVAASVEGTVSEEGAATSITAGSGLTGGGTGSVTLTVGQGDGIAVNADDVSLDIANLTGVIGSLDDEIPIADASNNNSIRKTTLRSVSGLSSPGGTNAQLQYNSNGAFAGDTATTNGNGTLSVTGLTATGTGIAINSSFDLVNDAKFIWPTGSSTTYHIGGTGGTPYLQGQSSAYRFSTTSTGYQLEAGAGNTVIWSSSTGAMTVSGLSLVMSNSSLRRSVTAGITASTTQSQGNGALTRDINEVSTCANANDTVTLPVAFAGRYCLVINNGAQTLQVFPASGDDLGAGVNTSTTIVAGSHKLFISYDATNWKQVI